MIGTFSKHIQRHTKLYLGFGLLTLVLLVGLGQDFLHSVLKDYNFQATESLLYNSFWVLFLPLSIFQLKGLKAFQTGSRFKNLTVMIGSIIVVSAIHFLLFPLIVNLVSTLFFSHVYTFNRVLFYGLSEHLYVGLAIYSLVAVFHYSRKTATPAVSEIAESPTYAKTISVSLANETSVLNVSEIQSIEAASPYVKLITSKGNFLHTETLKSMSEKLDPSIFVRVHKSTIINMNGVSSYKSRLNGDYDIRLSNGASTRMSRNYSQAFKALLNTHQVSLKN
ncbi:LytTR family DNA-binding domain-containing protein [uncultured Roseivirga sp.]|uniref:LytTR family DNA-binding domain-containing protein n=1 Tax=uncultured Roseivirga sp. TaxID=543088 RepID=UPI0030DCC4EF|tara:strand:+ start:209519 stop:210355 length:837 start_codon:yes stop_codon:yes gene_type:complete